MEDKDLEYIIKNSEGGIFNNAAQVWNHTFYFYQFTPKGKGSPSDGLVKAIEKMEYNEEFKEFNQAAATLFGSGWAWLVVNKNGDLEITKESNAGTPLTKGLKPILTFDVWEHAYYIDYQNRRSDYLNALWEIINWEEINQRFDK